MDSAFNSQSTTTTDNNISDNCLKANEQTRSLTFNKYDLLIKLKQGGHKPDIDSWVDYWFNTIGVNVLPANPQKKWPVVGWKEWQDKPIPESKINEWKKEKLFKGIIIFPGKVWRGDNQGKYLTSILIKKKQ